MSSTSLITASTKVKVSSTLDKSVGKKYLTDGSPETCWTSTQGTPQFVQLTFEQPVIPQKLSTIFQGGFVGTRCAIHVQAKDEDTWSLLTHLFPEDVNRRQDFDLPQFPENISSVVQIKLIFEESSDFFGRITIYDLALEGQIPDQS
ncbi:hypothetical protein M422DRAFT_58483 [Sphaerobolus stellatus SS14]|nr:hypothetical protein M422DRAFT_58483 [Sphaerobolus stellatus SS14]